MQCTEYEVEQLGDLVCDAEEAITHAVDCLSELSDKLHETKDAGKRVGQHDDHLRAEIDKIGGMVCDLMEDAQFWPIGFLFPEEE